MLQMKEDWIIQIWMAPPKVAIHYLTTWLLGRRGLVHVFFHHVVLFGVSMFSLVIFFFFRIILFGIFCFDLLLQGVSVWFKHDYTGGSDSSSMRPIRDCSFAFGARGVPVVFFFWCFFSVFFLQTSGDV